MANRFSGKSCVLCGSPSVGVGEHIWPSWLIKEFEGQGPFGSSKGGVPYTKKKDGKPTSSSGLPSVHVPMCEQCNLLLSRTIEEPAKGVLRRLIPWNDPHLWPVVSPTEAEALARWFLKVGILSAHPDAEHDVPQVNADPDVPRFSSMPPEWLEWMRTGTAPPVEFSVYVTRRLVAGEKPYTRTGQWIVLPDLFVAGEDLAYMTRSFGLRGLNITIVWHPGWPIRHPQVDNGRAAVLWPNPSTIDFALLPDVHPKEFRFIDGPIAPTSMSWDEFHRVAQTPLTVEDDPVGKFLGLSSYQPEGDDADGE